MFLTDDQPRLRQLVENAMNGKFDVREAFTTMDISKLIIQRSVEEDGADNRVRHYQIRTLINDLWSGGILDAAMYTTGSATVYPEGGQKPITVRLFHPDDPTFDPASYTATRQKLNADGTKPVTRGIDMNDVDDADDADDANDEADVDAGSTDRISVLTTTVTGASITKQCQIQPAQGSRNYRYPIEIELASKFAMFADPATGGDAVSYIAPPYSAAKGIFESVLFMPSARVIPTKVHVCRPTKFTKYSWNCVHSDLRKSDLRREGFPLQRREMMLYDVVFQLFAEVETIGDTVLSQSSIKYKGINHGHAFQEMFLRYIKRGRSQRHLCLGRTECVPSYWGSLRPESSPDVNVNAVLVQMLHHPFDVDQTPPTRQPVVSARYRQQVIIENGVLHYA